MSEHVHVFGRGANGKCRECGAESKAGIKRRLAREARAFHPQPREANLFSLYNALAAKSGFDYEGNAE